MAQIPQAQQTQVASELLLEDASGKGLLMKADVIATTYKKELSDNLQKCSRALKLVGILSTSSAPSRSYAEFTRKQCENLGVSFVLKAVGAALDPKMGEGEGVEEAIIEANDDDSVDGIMVYYPIFGSQQDHYLQQVVSPLKDVEGLHVKFHYNLYHNIRFVSPHDLLSSIGLTASLSNIDSAALKVKSILPCTPLAVVKCLEDVGVYNKLLTYGDRAYGNVITVINRSEVVGRPLAALLANDGAHVYSVDIDSIQEYTKRPVGPHFPRYQPRHSTHACNLTLEECLSRSNVVISAVPSKIYQVRTDWLKPGCVCINVSSEKNFEKNVREKASIYIPAVGKITILMLLRNLHRLREYQLAL